MTKKVKLICVSTVIFVLFFLIGSFFPIRALAQSIVSSAQIDDTSLQSNNSEFEELISSDDLSDSETITNNEWCNAIQFNEDYGSYQDNADNLNSINTSQTADGAINWVNSKVGQSIDYDGYYGAQCVDLIMAYYAMLGVTPARGNACDYVSNYLPDGWTRTQGAHPQKGDILVYTGGAYGHVAIYDSDYSVYQQNYNNHQWVEHTGFRYNDYNYFRPCSYWGCIHPNFSGGSKPTVDIEEGMYNLYSNVGHKAVDCCGGVAQCGTNVQIWSPNFTQAQCLHIYYNPAAGDHGQGGYHIEMGHTNLFLDTAGNVAGNGANVALWGDTGANGQYWVFEDAGGGNVYIRNLWGYYLDVDNGIDANGTNVQTWQWADVPAQKYHLQKCSGGNRIDLNESMFTLKSGVGNKFLDVVGGSTALGTNVQIYSPNSSDAQKFHIYYNPAAGDNSQGGWHIEYAHNNRFLDTAGDCGGPGTNVALWDDTGANGQYWVLEDAGYGYVYIRNLWGWYLDVDGGIEEDGRNVQVWSFNGSAGQKWLWNRFDYDGDAGDGNSEFCISADDAVSTNEKCDDSAFRISSLESATASFETNYSSNNGVDSYKVNASTIDGSIMVTILTLSVLLVSSLVTFLIQFLKKVINM